MRDQRSKHFDDDPHADQRGDVRRIVGRRNLDHFQASANAFEGRRQKTQELERLACGRKPPGSGQPVPGTKPQSSESTSNEM